MKFAWRDGTHSRIAAQVVGDRVEWIREQQGGTLRPDDLVADARSKQSPLHLCFEWNNAAAATEWRRSQAYYLLRHLAVEIQTGEGVETKPYRAYVLIQGVDEPNDGKVSVYISSIDAMKDPHYRKQVLERAFKELEWWQRRYAEYEELGRIVTVVEEVREAVLTA